MTADLVNAAFETSAIFAILANCRALWFAKMARGVSRKAVAFYTCWGFWSLFYLGSLGQWASFCGGVGIVSANALYVALLVHFRAN